MIGVWRALPTGPSTGLVTFVSGVVTFVTFCYIFTFVTFVSGVVTFVTFCLWFHGEP